MHRGTTSITHTFDIMSLGIASPASVIRPFCRYFKMVARTCMMSELLNLILRIGLTIGNQIFISLQKKHSFRKIRYKIFQCETTFLAEIHVILVKNKTLLQIIMSHQPLWLCIRTVVRISHADSTGFYTSLVTYQLILGKYSYI